MVKEKKIYLGFLRDRLRWLAFPHDHASIPLFEVECGIRRIIVSFYSLDDVIVMFVTVWVPFSSCVLLTPVPTRFSLRVVDVAFNLSLQDVGLQFSFEGKVRVLVVVTLEFNLVSRANSQFCSSSQDCERVLSRFFRMSLNESCYVLSELSRVCRRDRSSDDRFDKCDVFHRTNIIGLNKVSWISPPLSESHPADINCHRVDPPS